jgi:hypothetical protein
MSELWSVHNQELHAEVRPVHNQELHAEVCLKELEILPIPCQYIFSLMNFILKNQEHFKTNSSIHSTDTAMSTTCTDQMPTYLLSKKYSLCRYQNFQQS